MTGTWKLFAIILVLAMALALGACNLGDDDDDGGDTGNLPPLSGDDDDDAVDDDDDDDDDNDDNDDSDIDYQSVYCDLPDPEGIAPNMIGGGALDGTLTVYAFDQDCEPIQDAFVLHDGTVYQTDVDGKVEITIGKGAGDQQVVSWIELKGAVAYKADAKVMYFQHAQKIGDWADSEPSDFLDGADPIGLLNPQISGVLPLQDILAATAYLGVAMTGFSRNTLFRYDFNHLVAESTFDFDLGPFGGPTPLPANIYLPDLSIEITALGATFAGANEQYSVPVNAMFDENPIEGFVAAVSLTDVLTEEVLGDIIQTIIEGGSVTDALIGLTAPLITSGITFEYVGARPDWDGTGSAYLQVSEPTGAVDLDVANIDKSNDYLALMLAEIPNRALLPMSIGVAAGDPVAMDTAEIENADYIAAVINLDLENIFYASIDGLTFALAAKYAEDLEDWETNGVDFDADTDFLPFFNKSNTGFEYEGIDAGQVVWDLASDAEADLYGVIYDPACTGCPTVYATLPGDEYEFVVPFDELGITGSEDDVVAVVAGTLDGFDSDTYNPLTLFGRPISSMAVWTNFTIIVEFKE